MSETVVYMRGNLPFQVQRLVSAELIEDAKHLLSIDLDLLRALADELATYPSFLDKNVIKGIVAGYLTDDAQAEAVARLITGIDSQLRNTNIDVSGLVTAILDWQRSGENADGTLLSLSDAELLRDRLPIIIKPYPGLKRQSKAKYLSKVLGCPLESIEIICDLRPVFNDDRSVVEGMIPLTTLKVVCSGADGLPVSLEAVLSERAVTSLAKKATAATQKLKHLRDLMKTKALPIPALDMTKSEE